MGAGFRFWVVHFRCMVVYDRFISGCDVVYKWCTGAFEVVYRWLTVVHAWLRGIPFHSLVCGGEECSNMGVVLVSSSLIVGKGTIGQPATHRYLARF